MNKFSGLMIVAIAVFAIAPRTFAADDKTKAEASKEVRTKMADAHNKMAECLKTDKSFSDCRDEMRQSMSDNEEFGCGWGRGPRGRGAVSKAPVKEEAKKK